jgi:CRISPR/Cas system CSM-associated protein Csm2 small subunit
MALASTIAGQVLPSILKQFSGMSPEQLSSQPAFRSMLQLYISPATTDERIAAQKRMLAANVTSADFAAAGRLADNGLTSPLLGRRGLDGNGPSSFARTAELGGAMSAEVARVMDQARSEAMRLGMPWALNNPELLKLGAGAIKTLHDAGVQKERFERMVGDKVGFRAATAVDIAAFAKKHNLTPEQTNRLYDKISDSAEIISGGNKVIQRELDEATRRYVTGPDTPEARKALEESYRKHADTPEKRKAAEEVPKALIAATQRENAAVVKAEVKERTTENLDLYAQAAAPEVKPAMQTKQTDAGTPATNGGDKSKSAAVATPPKATAAKPA